MADIFTKQVYVEKVYLTFGLKTTMRKLEKDNSLDMLEISILFYLYYFIYIYIIFLQKIYKYYLSI